MVVKTLFSGSMFAVFYKSYESALSNAKDAIALWIETAKEFNDPIPEPKDRRLTYA